MRFIMVIGIVAAIVVLTMESCGPGLQTFSDHDTKADFSKYKTYAWLAPGDSVLNAPRADKIYGNLIVQVADAELQKKGMTIDVNTPDALFMFDSRVENKVQYTQSPTVSVGVGFGGPGYYVGGMAPVSGGQMRASTYEEGMLIYNMYDTRTGKLLWSGGARKEVTNSANIEATIKKAASFIFLKLPVKHKK
jgi:hypothetical protein